MKIILPLLLLLFITGAAKAQNLLGLTESGVKKYFSENEENLVRDTSFSNSTYKYQKYVDRGTELVTKIVFFNSSGLCSSVRAIYDLSLKADVVKELNSKYKRESENTWIDGNRKHKVKIRYLVEEWFITVEYKAYK